jgi:hypothetical protein
VRCALSLLIVFGSTPAARAGSWDGEAAIDTLAATSRSSDPGTGPSESLASADVGLRLRGNVADNAEKVSFHLDYWGRQPFAGAYRNARHHLLFAAVLRYRPEPDWTLSVGRFVAPSVLFLPMDGFSAKYHPERFEVELFGGRRGVTTSRLNSPLSEFRPALGARASYAAGGGRVEAVVAAASDQVRLGAGDSDAFVKSGVVRGSLRVGDTDVAAHVAASDQIHYALGPTWADATTVVVGPGLWSAAAWTRHHVTDDLRATAEVHVQRVSVVRDATTTADGQVADLFEPGFADVRLRIDASPADGSWIRGDGRIRRRPDRTEVRYGARADLRDVGVDGLTLDGSLHLEHLFASEDAKFAPAVDRLFWRAEAGWSDGPLDVVAGASVVERAAAPVSSRRVDPSAPDEPKDSDDLPPFVLGTQEIAYLRAFWAGRSLFGGIDVERSLEDGEWRAFAQIGWVGGGSW